ncbi:hypothetical protein BRD00_11200 [Halobacteriales archaeon QS_8_69_26]|nr:MAG: hypothetical protein BRD00_11200 [Halobacteriales archaeon QS_8_69_26]
MPSEKRDYVLIDSATDEEVLWLDSKLSFVGDKWQIRDPESEEVIVTIESQSKLAAIARNIHAVFGIIPHKYDIETADGEKIGSIEGQLSLKDRYDVEVDDTGDLSREAIIAAAMVIDAIEGN